MAESFHCSLCGTQTRTQGRLSLTTWFVAIFTLTFWLRVCEGCAKKVNAMSLGLVILLIALALIALGATWFYGS